MENFCSWGHVFLPTLIAVAGGASVKDAGNRPEDRFCMTAKTLLESCKPDVKMRFRESASEIKSLRAFRSNPLFAVGPASGPIELILQLHRMCKIAKKHLSGDGFHFETCEYSFVVYFFMRRVFGDERPFDRLSAAFL